MYQALFQLLYRSYFPDFYLLTTLCDLYYGSDDMSSVLAVCEAPGQGSALIPAFNPYNVKYRDCCYMILQLRKLSPKDGKLMSQNHTGRI